MLSLQTGLVHSVFSAEVGTSGGGHRADGPLYFHFTGLVLADRGLTVSRFFANRFILRSAIQTLNINRS